MERHPGSWIGSRIVEAAMSPQLLAVPVHIPAGFLAAIDKLILKVTVS